MATLKLGILVSGSGTNLQAIFDAIADHALDAEIRLVVSNVHNVLRWLADGRVKVGPSQDPARPRVAISSP